eukprot:m.166672 g.166672  ORF g.166672 m.166672 type:complete len:194 (-) comp16628_c0_seq3:2891-3472(-)
MLQNTRRVLQPKMVIMQPLRRRLHCARRSLAAAQDYYAVLGVRREATAKEIKTAYYLQSKKHHPDVSGDDPLAADRFALINEAYNVLSQVALRREYDKSDGRFRYHHVETGSASRGGSMANARKQGPLDYKTQYNFEEFYRKHYGESQRRREAQKRLLKEHEHLLQEVSSFVFCCHDIINYHPLSCQSRHCLW